jgi:microsomal dipeptidase-like Zn-dependent dipeptidase
MDDPNTNQPIQKENSDEAVNAKENLKAVLQVGLTIQMVTVIVAFAIKTGKTDFLTKLNEIILEMSKSLTDEEKKELQQDTDSMIAQKADELVKNMGDTMSPEELESAINDLKEIAKTGKDA